jgi:hypothetical protein
MVVSISGLVGCGIDSSSSPVVPQLVVESFITPGGMIDSVLVKRTIDPVLYYLEYENIGDRSLSYVSGAVVVVSDGTVTDTLTERSDLIGIYGTTMFRVESGKTYSIDISYNDPETGRAYQLHAATMVPFPVTNLQTNLKDAQIELNARFGLPATADVLVFPKELSDPDRFPPDGSSTVPIELSWDVSTNAAGYLVAASATDTTGASLLRRSDWKNWLDGDFKLDRDRRDGSTGAYQVSRDTLTIDVFWLAYQHASDNLLGLIAVDQNYWDYFRSARGNDNGPGTGADWDTGVIYNVDGGLGIFGSFAWPDTIRCHVVKEWDPVTEMSR